MNQHRSPVSLDPWLAASLMQKAIRRSDAELAVKAALALHRHRGTAIWRRLTIIAFEDIGIGDLDLVSKVTLCSIDRAARAPYGLDQSVIVDLVHRLASAPKDRSADYLICAVMEHPEFEAVREDIGRLSNRRRIAVAVDPDEPLMRRAIAMWYCSGVNGNGPRTLSRGDLPHLLDAFARRGLPDPLASIVETAARKTKEPLTIMIPLIWAMLVESGGQKTVARKSLPVSPFCRGIPLYAFDKHTRLGKRAISQFLRECDEVQQTLADFVPEFRHRDVAAMAAFYADAAPVALRLDWARSEELEALGREADMMKVGCPKNGVAPVLDVIRKNLDRLNAVRERLLLSSLPDGRHSNLFGGRA